MCRISVTGKPKGAKVSAWQSWVVHWAPTALQKGPNDGAVSTPLPIKLLTLASPSPHLDSNRKGRCVSEERTLRNSQTGKAQLSLSCKATKCSDAGTGDLGVVTTHETLPVKMTSFQAFSASVRDMGNSIGDAGSTRHGWSQYRLTAGCSVSACRGQNDGLHLLSKKQQNKPGFKNCLDCFRYGQFRISPAIVPYRCWVYCLLCLLCLFFTSDHLSV